VPPTEGFLATTQLNLTIEGRNALQVRNNVANVQGDVDLTVRGTLASPVVFGTVEVEEGGELVYADNEYRIERGLLTFNDPYRINPLVDLVARTEVRNFDITLSLAGPLDKLDFSLSSNSDLADLEILSLLATGQEVNPGGTGLPPRPGEAQTQPGATQGAMDFLYGQAASAISERVNTLFGFDRLRINPTTETGQGISGVSVTVGKRLSRDVFVTYTNLPGTDEQYVAQVEWQLSDNVTLVLTNTGRDYYAVDVQWEKRF
jgi:translocation and assembly module TamB